jgi:AcrR family transcriptional regulator
LSHSAIDKNERSFYFWDMSKGELTRQHILQHAASLASRVGLTGLSIGALAEELELSKSGLFAHFQSKEGLQLQLLEFAAGRFIEAVVRPTLSAPRGEPRVRALFENWMRWPKASGLSGGCFFIAAAIELDDQPGPARARLVELQRDWMETIANTVRTAVGEQHFRKDLDPEQFAQDLYGILLGYQYMARLLGDPKAEARARRAFEALLGAARKPRS